MGDPGSLGSIQITSDGGILPGNPDRDGSLRPDTSGISDSDHYWNHNTFGEEVLDIK